MSKLIKYGQYIINLEKVNYIQLKDETGEIIFHFDGGQTLDPVADDIDDGVEAWQRLPTYLDKLCDIIQS